MRLLHPQTIQILASHQEFPKTHLAHCWSEIFKFLASGQKHPKMFINNYQDLGVYLGYLYGFCITSGVNADIKKVANLPNKDVIRGFNIYLLNRDFILMSEGVFRLVDYFDDNYLFSDACSLYFKGINIFPDIFGDEWRKYVPVESLKEIKRQVDKTLKIN